MERVTGLKPEGAEFCKAFATDEGCSYGWSCLFYHPLPFPSEGKCFNCGKKGCTVAVCERPKQPPGEKGKGKSFLSNPHKTIQRGYISKSISINFLMPSHSEKNFPS